MRDQMNMVRHYHEAPGKPAITRRTVQQKPGEAFKRGLVIEDAGTAIHAEREQV
jgi:hypothetical protein